MSQGHRAITTTRASPSSRASRRAGDPDSADRCTGRHRPAQSTHAASETAAKHLRRVVADETTRRRLLRARSGLHAGGRRRLPRRAEDYAPRGQRNVDPRRPRDEQDDALRGAPRLLHVLPGEDLSGPPRKVEKENTSFATCRIGVNMAAPDVSAEIRDGLTEWVNVMAFSEGLQTKLLKCQRGETVVVMGNKTQSGEERVEPHDHRRCPDVGERERRRLRRRDRRVAGAGPVGRGRRRSGAAPDRGSAIGESESTPGAGSRRRPTSRAGRRFRGRAIRAWSKSSIVMPKARCVRSTGAGRSTEREAASSSARTEPRSLTDRRTEVRVADALPLRGQEAPPGRHRGRP